MTPRGAGLALALALALSGLSAASWQQETGSLTNEGNGLVAEVQTSKGTMVLELHADVAPNHVKNFQELAGKGFYDGLIFHRVIDGFMIQGGGMTREFIPKPTRSAIQNEANNGLKTKRGTIAMARTGDPHSATSQFFINVSDNGFLDHPGQDGWGYCVFGAVTEGMDVVEKIKGVATGSKHGHQDVPKEDVVIEKAEILD